MLTSSFVAAAAVIIVAASATTHAVSQPQAIAPQSLVAITPMPTPAGDFAFLAKDGNRPVRYDPCTPIHYVVNLSEAPPHAMTDVHRAIAEISQATGLSFVDDGLTDEIPMAHRGMTKDARYHGWPPLLIGWAKPGETDLLSNGAIGEGGSTWIGNPGGEVYVTGVVVIDSTQNAKLHAGFGGDSVGAVLLHELGHVVGLDHVADQSQIMFATVTDKPAVLGAGDLAGLTQLGRDQGCLVEPRPQWPS